MNNKIHEFCNNIPEDEKIRHVLFYKNLKLVRAFIDSNLCNIYTLSDNSLIVECRDNIEDFKKLQTICNNTKGFEKHGLCFSEVGNYSNFIEVL